MITHIKGYEEQAMRLEIPNLVINYLYIKDLKLRREEEKKRREIISIIYIYI